LPSFGVQDVASIQSAPIFGPPLLSLRHFVSRALLLFAMAVLCASCRTDAQLDPAQTTPTIDVAEINAREDCLYREVGRLLEPKGSPFASLHNISVSATRFCSEAIRTRLQRASVSVPDAQNLARDDQVKTEQRAFAIGLELREKRTNSVVADR
jgi:hypothetical protein